MKIDIPTIDFLSKDVEQQVWDAFTNYGMAQFANLHTPWKPDLEKFFQYVIKFFDLPSNTKHKYSDVMQFKNLGYIWPEREKLVLSNPGDMKETFNFVEKSKMPETYWPKEIPELREYAERFIRISTLISYDLLYVFEKLLQQPRGHFVEKHLHAISGMRMIHYPKWEKEIEENQFRCGAHTDFDTFTILYRDDCEGLQIYLNDQWYDVPVVKDTIVVMSADMLQRWSNGRFKSTLHRVGNISMDRSRYTLTHFVGPANDTMLNNLTDEEDKYESLTSSEFLDWRYKYQFVDNKFVEIDNCIATQKETINEYHDYERIPEHDQPHYWR